jgi:hypothetical protein
MANSCLPGPLQSFRSPWSPFRAPARSPGTLGLNDQGDPNCFSLLGDTPGALGLCDLGDPSLSLMGGGFMPAFSLCGAPVATAPTKAGQRSFLWGGCFVQSQIESGFTDKFSKTAHYDALSIPNLVTLLGFLEDDDEITDLRWMAYMLATAYWETSHIEKRDTTVKDKKGKLITRKVSHWINMKPTDEMGHGAGRDYYLPVKVQMQANGDALVTEQDGDQFTVKPTGTNSPSTKGMTMGSDATAKADKDYTKAGGTELAYYGRGYVQLTWWANYAKAGVALKQGLDLLKDPDKVMEPETAYALMSHGMRTGQGFANGHKLADYFAGVTRNYTGARHMVNGKDHAADIAALAEKFEDLLYECRDLT